MSETSVPDRSSATVTVRGLGVAHAEPDGLRLQMTVRHQTESAQDALNEAARRAQVLADVFSEHRLNDDQWVTSGIRLEQWSEWDNATSREIRRGYVASATTVVTLNNSAGLGAILAESAGRVEATFEGPWWRVDPGNPAHQEARRLAMEDARRRATTYAEAEGLGVGAPMEIAEPGLRPGRHGRALSGFGGDTLAAAAADMPVHTGGLEITAAVDVTYSLIPAANE
jgi:uncharacterized protein YggE